MNRRLAFTQADVRRLFKGAAEAGVTIAIEIAADGTLRGIPCNPVTQPIGEFDVMGRIAGTKF